MLGRKGSLFVLIPSFSTCGLSFLARHLLTLEASPLAAYFHICTYSSNINKVQAHLYYHSSDKDMPTNFMTFFAAFTWWLSAFVFNTESLLMYCIAPANKEILATDSHHLCHIALCVIKESTNFMVPQEVTLTRCLTSNNNNILLYWITNKLIKKLLVT